MASIIAGIDTGGTFTDLFVINNGQVSQCKVLSTPGDPSKAITEGLRRLGIADLPVQIIHGTTVGTNAVLENKGARVAYVASTGFADLLSLGRQQREEVYRLDQPSLAPPVPEDLCFEIDSRILADGRLQSRATEADLDALVEAIARRAPESIAINLLFSFLRPELEQQLADRLRPDYFVSTSSEVLPELREYERGIATWLDASVGPVISAYLGRLAQRLPRANISVMQSSGTTVASGQASHRAVHLLLSGPAGGLAAAHWLGKAAGTARLLTFDMGGTSTDVSLIDGQVPLTSNNRIGPWPLGVASVDIHTIGAGGGSIARVDRAGMLLVGPESAGADPGPACYGQGGDRMTVTDANVVLGRIPASTLLGGHLALDTSAAETVADRLAANLGCSRLEAARGVIRLANEHMARALRVMSVERGHHPGSCALFSFGGAGGLHACELAGLLGMRDIILPASGGVLSALGMVVSEPGRYRSRAILKEVNSVSDEALLEGFGVMASESATELEQEGVSRDSLQEFRTAELRYTGQSNVVELPWEAGLPLERLFHEAHESRIGHRLALPVELVNIRSSMKAGAPLSSPQRLEDKGLASPCSSAFVAGEEGEVTVYRRTDLGRGASITGPAILVEDSATCWLARGWQATCDDWGNLVLRRDGS